MSEELKVTDRRWWARGADAVTAEEPKLKPTYIEELEARLAAKDAELQQIISKYRGASEEFEQARARLGLKSFAFLNKVNAEVPDDLDVHVILDNLSTHKTPAVHDWLLRHRRFHFHFTPTYGSWMNLVERWFSALTTKKLQRSAHPSVKALADDIQAWVDAWNDNPKPFVWHKTADQILDRLAGYCQAVNN